MLILIAFYYASILFVGLVGSWVIESRSGRTSVARIQWWVVAFPMILSAITLLKPQGPEQWIFRVNRPGWIDWTVLAMIVLLVSVRGMWEIIRLTITWTRLLNRSVSGQFLMSATWLNYKQLVESADLARTPEIRIHQNIKSPFVIGWLDPVIMFPAEMVPVDDRGKETFWQGVDCSDADARTIQNIISHELGHVRSRDHLRLAVLALNACLIPWEWIVGNTDLERSPLTKTAVFRYISKAFRFVGYPYSRGLEAEREAQERHAGAIEMRQTFGHGSTGKSHWMIREVWRETAFTLVCIGILWIAPGISVVRFAMVGQMTSLSPIPSTWHLALEPGYGAATAGLATSSRGGRGQIVVNVDKVVPWHWPKLSGIGRINVDDLPEKDGFIDMLWDIYSEDNVPKALAVHLQLAEIPMVETTRQDAYTVRADPSEGPKIIGRNLYRFHRRLYVGMNPRPSWIYIDYYFQDKGRWVFNPPVLAYVTTEGRVTPLP